MATKRDYYDILGVSKTATDAELKSAYRKMALQWHPDRNKAPEAEAKFKEVNEAYQILSDKQKRAQYDQFGHAAPGGFGGQGGFGGYQQQGPFSYTYTNMGGQNPFGGDFEGFSDPFDIFEQFFGGSAGARRRTHTKPHYSLKIDFMTAVKGGSEQVTINNKKHTIKIPAGTDTGTHLRFTDFDITFEVEPHAKFKRDGDDVYVDQVIPFTTAILGGEVTVQTLDGDLKVKIRPGTQPNSMVRLSGRGITKLRSIHKDDRGDLYIRLNIEIPTNLTRKQKQLIEEFEKQK